MANFKKIFISLLLGIFIFFNSSHLQATVYNGQTVPMATITIDSPSYQSSTLPKSGSKFFIPVSLFCFYYPFSIYGGLGYQFTPSFSLAAQIGCSSGSFHFGDEKYTAITGDENNIFPSVCFYGSVDLRILPTFYLPVKGRRYDYHIFGTLGISFSQLSASLTTKWKNGNYTMRILDEDKNVSSFGVLLHPKIGILIPSAFPKIQTGFSVGALFSPYRNNVTPSNKFVQVETKYTSQAQYIDLNTQIIPNWFVIELQMIGKFF